MSTLTNSSSRDKPTVGHCCGRHVLRHPSANTPFLFVALPAIEFNVTYLKSFILTEFVADSVGLSELRG